MRRQNTASPEMIARVDALRKTGITEFYCTTYYTKDGALRGLSPVIKHTAQGISSYANAMYTKYGDTVSVDVSYFDSDYRVHTLTTYQC